MELLSIILVIASLLPFAASDGQGYSHAYHMCFLLRFSSLSLPMRSFQALPNNKEVPFDYLGDALYDMKLKLNATGSQLSDWNQNQVNPCTWNSVICDNNNHVVQV